MFDVSVVMPVKNGGNYLALAVDSILTQADAQFELLVVDDGSTDGSWEYLHTISDPRLKLIRSGGGGLVDALNTGVQQSSAPLIARMDADDVCLPGRLRAQIEVFKQLPSVGLVYTSVYIIDEAGKRLATLKAQQCSRAEHRARLLDERSTTPIVHPTVMMRRSTLDAVGGYRQSDASEDHELWLRLVAHCEFFAIEKPLLEYRHHQGGVSRSKAMQQATSHILNAVCFRVKELHGTDLMMDAPIVYDHLKVHLIEAHGLHIAAIVNSRRLRTAIRRGSASEALKALRAMHFKHWSLLSRRLARRTQVRIQMDLTNAAAVCLSHAIKR